MKRVTVRLNDPSQTKALVKRIIFLAWKACGGPMGMGWLQDRGPDLTEEQVWEQIYENADYPGGNWCGENKEGQVYGDYVFGRMMKFGVSWTEDGTITAADELNPSYNAFARTYPTARKLITAAAAELGLVLTMEGE